MEGLLQRCQQAQAKSQAGLPDALGRGIKMHLNSSAAVKLYQNGMSKFH